MQQMPTTLTVGDCGEDWIDLNFATDHFAVTTLIFDKNRKYGPFYLVNNSSTSNFIKSTLVLGEKEEFHWVGFIKPISVQDARILWALPTDRSYTNLWEIYIESENEKARGFVGLPKYKSNIGTTLAMNLNNEAVLPRNINLKPLGILKPV
jgi:hypothetical protein